MKEAIGRKVSSERICKLAVNKKGLRTCVHMNKANYSSCTVCAVGDDRTVSCVRACNHDSHNSVHCLVKVPREGKRPLLIVSAAEKTILEHNIDFYQDYISYKCTFASTYV